MNLQESINYIKEHFNDIHAKDAVDKIKKIIKIQERKVGFTEFHMSIWKYIRQFSTRKEYQYAASRITGYEKIWILSIANLLNDNIKFNNYELGNRI